MKNRLHVLRAERRLTQAALGDALGVSRQTINAIETGKYDPSLPLAFKIAGALRDSVSRRSVEPDAEPPTTAGKGDRIRDVIERAS